MPRLTILFTLIISALHLFGQDKKIVLRIDTLVLNGYDNFSIEIEEQGFMNFHHPIDDSVYIQNTTGYPHFICPLTLKTDTSNIRISIDDEGGYLLLMDVYQLKSDTLRIRKLIVFNNCYRDTTFTQIAYFIKKTDGSIDQPFRVKNSKEVEKKRCKNRPLLNTTYHINGTLYSVSIEKQTDNTVGISSFHGYKPRKYLEDRDNFKGKVTYFHGQSSTTHYINVITLKIKNSL